MAEKIAVVGAGLAGVTAALALQEAGYAVVVFDKSRGFGGRLATRRGEGFAIDHGAAAAHGAAPGFAAAMAAAGAVDAADGVAGGWIGQPGMSAIVRAMAGPLDCVMATEITGIEADRDGLILADAAGARHGPFDRVLSAIPAPQARRFLAGRPEDAALAEVVMDPVWTLLLAFAEPLEVGASLAGAPFDSILRASSRPGRAALPETWVAHAGAEWTRANLEMTKEAACAVLREAFAGAVRAGAARADLRGGASLAPWPRGATAGRAIPERHGRASPSWRGLGLGPCGGGCLCLGQGHGGGGFRLTFRLPARRVRGAAWDMI